ncbi:L,D-transpeptidase family protein [Solirubrobacter ginsenosidimutans]|uniref:L,D-transpeptidase family protein n=1 Tax=Solirubrobacter ginsenosidimutans TaxID=490573 RepID=A0A9X3S7N0_9ACTN|nr:L,D-transpeptidase family protein [Solirubrobacter ginsenosidimutans]MDA0166246.1 L,D-transpeptidase family protein [Solirubrobacter ginsenosidimutans]
MKRPALALLMALALPAQAAAQTPPDPVPTPPPAVPTPAPTPPPAATAKLSVSVLGGLSGKTPAALTGQTFTARVVMKPFVANEGAVLRVYRGSKKLQVKSLKFKAVNGGTAGVAQFKVSSKVSARLTLKVSHRATPGLVTTVAKPLRINVVRAYAGPGSKGPAVKYLQERLAALHYVTSRSGVYDGATGRAIMAWRKVAGYSRTYIATPDVFSGMLKGRGVFKVRHPGDGRHVEARLNQQVLALINGSKVERIYHTSSGKPSTPTVQGKFRVYMKTPGTNAKGMVDSNYFIRGYAIHGYADVPAYNASHGCLRVPVPNARSIYDWLRIGDVVWVEP